jgi:hypothetical protein
MKKAAKTPRAGAVRYPSKASLAEMPERAPDARVLPNRFAARIAKDGGQLLELEGAEPQWLPANRGRPKTGATSEVSKPRSLRLPDSVWERLQARAEAEGVGVHTLLRKLVASYLEGPAKVQPRAHGKRDKGQARG